VPSGRSEWLESIPQETPAFIRAKVRTGGAASSDPYHGRRVGTVKGVFSSWQPHYADAARNGVSTRNATLYTTTFPCQNCATAHVRLPPKSRPTRQEALRPLLTQSRHAGFCLRGAKTTKCSLLLLEVLQPLMCMRWPSGAPTAEGSAVLSVKGKSPV
jgi:hypothetical protein